MAFNLSNWRNTMTVVGTHGPLQQQAPQQVRRPMSVVSVIDPQYKAGKVDVPVEMTYETKGRNDWLSGVMRKDLSICCLFQKGRCHADVRCHQIHVDRDYCAAVRVEMAKVVSCCRRCNDTASVTPAALSVYQTNGNKPVHVHCLDNGMAVNSIPFERLANTPGLTQLVQAHGNNTVAFHVDPKVVCRLHLRGACKYGKDCKNLHICAELGEGVLFARFQHPCLVTPVPAVRAAAPAAVNLPSSTPTPANTPASAALSAPASGPATPRPMPTFALPADAAPLPAFGAIGTKCKGDLDPIAVQESSGRMGFSGFLSFDPLRALEDSAATPEADDLEVSLTPGSKRRASTDSHGMSETSPSEKAFRLSAWHPSSQSQVPYAPDCKLAATEVQKVLFTARKW